MLLRPAKKEPSVVLLSAQLLSLLLYPFLEGRAVQRALFSALGIAILGLVVLAVRSSPIRTYFGLALAIPACVLLVIGAVTGSDKLLP